VVLATQAGKRSVPVNTISPDAARTEEFEQMIGALARRRRWTKRRCGRSSTSVAR
jgi:hypothetical protein